MLYDSLYIILIETKRLVVTRGWWKWSVTKTGYQVSFWGDDSALEMEEVVVQHCECTKYRSSVYIS